MTQSVVNKTNTQTIHGQNSSGAAEAVSLSGIPAEQALIENTGTYIYEGFAAFGVATSAASWVVVRTTLSGSNITAVERADGDSDPDNVWDNRASLSYS